VKEHWLRLNPDRRPTLLFACGKPESLWFAQEFARDGIRAAHIDGNEVWLDGVHYPSDKEKRDEVRKLSQAGELPIVCNRFVLREGMDWPWLKHGIFATVFGALSSYLQSGGRLLRSHPSMRAVVLQDHGGNWHRHGDINQDRDWDLDDTDYKIGATRVRQMKLKNELEPIICPQCFAPRVSGAECPECGHRSTGRSRRVVQINGTLKIQTGDIYKTPRYYDRPDAEKKWTACVYRCKRLGRTFNQARGLFQYENFFAEPPVNMPLMPKNAEDWFLPVGEVPRNQLS